ncbi:MAG: AAA family ATPase [Clostridiales bacterium]|nr:AAA family ATPase [Clostridiales bacterium]
MRIKKIMAKKFGCLKDFESPDIESNMVVVFGSNEAGKSTFFNLISTLFYGWSPVSDNPYIPWEDDSADCEGVLEGDDGNMIKVYRRLRSRGDGYYIQDEKRYNLANRPIPQAENLPYQIFKEVYAVNIDNMCFPSDNVWQKILSQLLGGQYVSFLNPVREVAASLEKEAQSLWRRDNLGKPEDKLLRQKSINIKQKIETARENEEYMHGEEKEIDSIQEKIDALNERKIELIKYFDRMDRLYPVFLKIKRIDKLNRDAGNIESIKKLPADACEVLSGIKDNMSALEEQIEDCSNQRKALEDRINSFTVIDKKVLGFKNEIEMLLSRGAGEIQADISSIDEIKDDILRFKDRITNKCREFLQGGWDERLASKLEKIDEAELRYSIQNFKALDEKCKEQELKFSALKYKAGGMQNIKHMPYFSLVLWAAGIIGLLLKGNAPVKFISLLLLVSGAFTLFLYFYLKRGQDTVAELKEGEKGLNAAKINRDEALEKVKASLLDLPVASSILERPDESIILNVMNIKELLYNIRCGRDKIDKKNKALDDNADIIKKIAEGTGMKISKDILNDISAIRRIYKQAAGHMEDATGAQKGMEEISKKATELKYRMDLEQKKAETIEKGLNSFEGDSMDEKTEDYAKRRKCMETAEALKNELLNEHPDIDEIKNEIQKTDDWNFEEDYTARAKDERENIEKELNGLNERLGALKKDIDNRKQMERLDDLKGQEAYIEDERRECRRKRDYLMLLRNVLLEAERKYRDENQPDVLARAGEYLSIITGGRYFKLSAEEDGRSLVVKGNCREEYMNIENMHLSRGTKEQIYLSLRLALSEHLNSGSASLPIFLDEVLVDWDDMRLDNGLKLLAEIAKSRQVFLFTCRRQVCDTICKSGSIQLIELC